MAQLWTEVAGNRTRQQLPTPLKRENVRTWKCRTAGSGCQEACGQRHLIYNGNYVRRTSRTGMVDGGIFRFQWGERGSFEVENVT